MWVRRYSLTETPEKLLRRLQAAQGSNAAAERSRARVGKIAMTGIIGFFVLFFSIFVLAVVWNAAAKYALFGLLLWSVGAVVLAVGSHLHAITRDLDDNKLAAVTQLVSLLRADVPHGRPLQLVVDFRDYRKGARTRLTSLWRSFFLGERVHAYRHQWLRMQVPLADGSTLLLQATDTVKRKERDKRKRPTRVGERMRGALEVALRLGKGYEDGAVIASRLAEAGHPMSLERTTAKGRGRQVHVGFRTGVCRRRQQGSAASPTPQTGDTLLRALRFTYGALAPRRA